MPRGKVKLLVTKRGYGFIAPADGDDVFFAHNAVPSHGFRKLELGQEVEFELIGGAGRSAKGPRAKLVTIPADEPEVPASPEIESPTPLDDPAK